MVYYIIACFRFHLFLFLRQFLYIQEKFLNMVNRLKKCDYVWILSWENRKLNIVWEQ